MSRAHVSIHTEHAASHGSLTSYIAGFILSLGLTAVSFGAIMTGSVPRDLMLPAITFLAVAQLLVQLLFFLHLGTAPEQRNSTVIFLLTTLLIAIVVAGSLWVMHNANINMMPTQMSIERARAKD
jgi:cytochrome o ubiquinol oxidase operon protein cyoD